MKRQQDKRRSIAKKDFPLRVLVCGDRNWTDRSTMFLRLLEFPPGTLIIHGDAPGADRMSGEIGSELLMNVLAVPAQWEKYGKAAGPIRNREMFKLSKPDLVLAFHDDIANSKGTKDMVYNVAKPSGVKIEIIQSKKANVARHNN